MLFWSRSITSPHDVLRTLCVVVFSLTNVWKSNFLHTNQRVDENVEMFVTLWMSSMGTLMQFVALSTTYWELTASMVYVKCSIFSFNHSHRLLAICFSESSSHVGYLSSLNVGNRIMINVVECNLMRIWKQNNNIFIRFHKICVIFVFSSGIMIDLFWWSSVFLSYIIRET